MQPFRPQVQRSATLHDDVTHLARGPTSDPGLAVEDQPTPDPGAPPDPEDRVELLPAPSSNCPTATSTSLPIRTGTPNWSERCPRESAPPAWEVPGAGHHAGLSSASPGEPIRLRRDPGCRGLPARPPLGAWRRFRARRPRACPCRAWAVATRRELCCRIDDDGLDFVLPRSILPRGGYESTLTAGTITAAFEKLRPWRR